MYPPPPRSRSGYSRREVSFAISRSASMYTNTKVAMIANAPYHSYYFSARFFTPFDTMS